MRLDKRLFFFNCVGFLSRIKEVSSKPRKEYAPKPRMTLELLPPSESHNGGIHSAKSPGRSPGREVYSGLLNETPFCQDYNHVLTQQT